MNTPLKNFLKNFPVDADKFGYSARFENCTAKNGDRATGEYELDNNEIYFHYVDSKGLEYRSLEMPAERIELAIAIDYSAPTDKH